MCVFRCFVFSVQAQLSVSQRKMCNELSRLKGEEVEEVEEDVPDGGASLQAALQVLRPLLR